MVDLIRPLLKDDDLLADVAAHRERPGFRLWWLGQSGFLLQHGARHVLIDPYLSDSLTRKYAETDKPHIRMTERVVDPARLDFIDVATSSHNHTDHLDAETLLAVRRASPTVKLVVPAANIAFASDRLAVDPDELVGVDAGGTIEVAGFRIHGVPAAHESLETDADGRHIYLGYVFGFGPHQVYHSGDTVPYPGMVELLRPLGVDVALLPINGRAAERRVAGNLWGHEAARLAHDIGARLVIPCHYDMFTFNTATPVEFIAACESLGQAYRVLRCGESVEVTGD